MQERTSLQRIDFLIGIAFILCALALRLLFVSQEAINADEHFWHERTNRFHTALTEHSLEKTLVAGHPGATVTWFSLVSLKVTRPLYRVFDPTYDHQDFPYLTQTFNRVHFAYQLPIILISSLLVGLVYGVLRLLVNQRYAVLASLLVLSDVFFLAHSRLVQMDALQACFLVSSLLIAVLAGQRENRWLYAATGVLVGLSITTKLYSAALLPVLLFVLYAPLFHRQRATSLQSAMVRAILWCGIPALLTTLVLLPSLLVSPMQVFESFRGALFEEGVKGLKEGSSYFFGHLLSDGEPRIYYLVSLLFRQSVLPFVLLPLTLVLLLLGKLPAEVRSCTSLFFGAALWWTALLSIPNKMEDRYILPTHLFVDLAVAGGLYAVVQWWRKENVSMHIRIGGLVLIFLLGVFSVNGLQHQYLAYYNPLLGGVSSASRFIQVGWGEGIQSVADYLNSQKNPDRLKVASWHEGALAPYCLCEVDASFSYDDPEVGYVVFYRDQLQRNHEELMTEEYFHPDFVAYTSLLNGYPYAWLVKKPGK